MVSRATYRLLVLCMLGLSAGLSGSGAKADPIYNVTNLGSGNITYTTASDGTSSATTQYVSVSNGQVSYSFATTPDTPLLQGQGALSNIPSSLNVNPAVYESPEVAGYANPNGFAVLLISLPVTENPPLAYTTAVAYPLAPNGQVQWNMGVTITSSPDGGFDGGYTTIAGVSAANQALVGTGYSGREYDALVYNFNTQTVTDLDSLPAITAGDYTNLQPIAIDNQGQILVRASPVTSNAAVTLLLTPGGTAPDPVTTPEPGSLVLWSAIACASYLAVRRARGSVLGPAASCASQSRIHGGHANRGIEGCAQLK